MASPDHRPQQGRPGLIVECDHHAGGWQVHSPLLALTPEEKERPPCEQWAHLAMAVHFASQAQQAAKTERLRLACQLWEALAEMGIRKQEIRPGSAYRQGSPASCMNREQISNMEDMCSKAVKSSRCQTDTHQPHACLSSQWFSSEGQTPAAAFFSPCALPAAGNVPLR